MSKINEDTESVHFPIIESNSVKMLFLERAVELAHEIEHRNEIIEREKKKVGL